LPPSHQRNIPLRRQRVSGPAEVVMAEIPVAADRNAPAIFSVSVHEPLHDGRHIPQTVRIGQKKERFPDRRILADFDARQLQLRQNVSDIARAAGISDHLSATPSFSMMSSVRIQNSPSDSNTGTVMIPA